MIGGDQMLFYLQCIVSVSDLVFYRDIGNNICCSFRTRCGICLVWSFLNWYRVIFLSRWSFSGCRWCTSLPKYDFLALSSIAHTTPSLLGRSFSVIPRFHKALFRSSTLMITKSPILTCCSFPWITLLCLTGEIFVSPLQTNCFFTLLEKLCSVPNIFVYDVN